MKGGHQVDRMVRGPRKRCPRTAHLVLARDFDTVYRTGVRVRGETILLVAAPRVKGCGHRLGRSVGRRYSKRAVDRNRLRRLLLEAFRHLPADPLPPLDMILIPLGSCRAVSLAQLSSELKQLVHRARKKLQCVGS